jgi:hypothetical protein
MQKRHGLRDGAPSPRQREDFFLTRGNATPEMPIYLDEIFEPMLAIVCASDLRRPVSDSPECYRSSTSSGDLEPEQQIIITLFSARS